MESYNLNLILVRNYFLKQLVVAYEIPLPIEDFGDDEVTEFLNKLKEELRYRVNIQKQEITTSELEVSNYLFTFNIVFNCKVGYLTLNEYDNYFETLREEIKQKLEEFFTSRDVYYIEVLVR